MQGFETIYRRFDSSPGNTVSIQGQVHVAVRALLAKYQDDKDNGAITSITTAGKAKLLGPHRKSDVQPTGSALAG